MRPIAQALSVSLILVLALAAQPGRTVYADHGGPHFWAATWLPPDANVGDLVTVQVSWVDWPAESYFNVNGGSWISMTPLDGAWDEDQETASGTFTADTFGSNTLCTKAASAAAVWSTTTCWQAYMDDKRGPITSSVAVSPNPAVSGGLVTVTAVVDDSTTAGSNINFAAFSVNGVGYNPMEASDGAYDEVSEGVTGSFIAETTGTATVCVWGFDVHGNLGAASCTDLTVESGYDFGGFLAPVSLDGTKAKGGHKFALRFWLNSAVDGSAVSDPGAISGLSSYDVACTTLVGDPSSAVAEANASLAYLGNSLWLVDWQIPDSYADTCRMVFVLFSDGSTSPAALFQFK